MVSDDGADAVTTFELFGEVGGITHFPNIGNFSHHRLFSGDGSFVKPGHFYFGENGIAFIVREKGQQGFTGCAGMKIEARTEID